MPALPGYDEILDLATRRNARLLLAVEHRELSWTSWRALRPCGVERGNPIIQPRLCSLGGTTLVGSGRRRLATRRPLDPETRAH